MGDLDRYTSQMTFWGEEKQRELGSKTAVVVGLGALGSVAASLLVRAGVNVVVIDHDIVELSNVQRQLYSENNVGQLKVDVTVSLLKNVNSDVSVVGHAVHLGEDNTELLDGDIVLDCTDSMESRLVINKYCLEKKIPWVHAASAGTIGVVLPVFGEYCFGCVYGSNAQALSCGDLGIVNAASSMTASLQTGMVFRILLGEDVSGLVRFDVWKGTFDNLVVKKNPSCGVCGSGVVTEAKEKELFTVGRCKTRAAMSAKPVKSVKLDLGKIKKEFETLLDTPIVIVINVEGVEIIVHQYGELVFKNFYDEEKVREIAEKVYGVGQ
jgi:molybdopterin-synthase adenylyltransferase